MIKFFKVSTNEEKVQKISDLVAEYYHKKERFLILAPNERAAQYLDQLLWRLPKESFLPHEVAEKKVKANIAITVSGGNVNQASVLLNLGAKPIKEGYETVLELMDETDPEKKKRSEERLVAYQRLGMEIDN
jgi:DNA polymerase-3 subunit chi